MCYYFNNIIIGTKVNFSNTLQNKKLYENISVYKISYKTPVGPKLLRFMFDKIDGFIISLDGKIKHLIIFDYRLLDKIFEKIEYLISKKAVLQIILIATLEGSELIHIVLYSLKKINFS